MDQRLLELGWVSQPVEIFNEKQNRHYQVFAVKVRVDNPQGIFKAGLAAEVVLPLQGAD